MESGKGQGKRPAARGADGKTSKAAHENDLGWPCEHQVFGGWKNELAGNRWLFFDSPWELLYVHPAQRCVQPLSME